VSAARTRTFLRAAPELAQPAVHTPLDELLARADIVAAVLPLTSATHETRRAMAVLATSNLLQALAGEQPIAVYPLHS
jgi:lactate dehydrogenase-like 2-hydroxyacid dehydrogenase